MLTTLRLYYLTGVRTRDDTVGWIKSALCGSLQSIRSAKAAWRGSTSMFDRSPLDAIAVERLFEIERNFLKINGYEYPPLRSPRPPFGYATPCPFYTPCTELKGYCRHVRVEFYADAERSRICRSNADCWADVPLLSSGQLELAFLQSTFSFDPQHFAVSVRRLLS